VKDADLKRWAETWDRARRELAILRRRDLARITDEQAKAAALDVLSIPIPEDLPARSGSGLVEQQRLFARLRQPLSSRGTTLLPTPSRRDTTPLSKRRGIHRKFSFLDSARVSRRWVRIAHRTPVGNAHPTVD
jgi:hypothetical protein